jgi:mannosyl-glycoprotein endo-beta-N-acetylglucosaminidase
MGKNGDAFLRIMPGLAKLIVKAAKDCALSPLYCASHCMTEFSTPSVGMPQDGKTYYNFFGIGAFQATQAGVDSARKFAKSRGWDSPEKGMKGGIEFLRDWIYDSADSRENLYDMRWDLKSQRKVYGTAVNWATGAATFMAQIYDLQPKKPEIVLLVPRFKK